jgi:hypothetical protein
MKAGIAWGSPPTDGGVEALYPLAPAPEAFGGPVPMLASCPRGPTTRREMWSMWRLPLPGVINMPQGDYKDVPKILREMLREMLCAVTR